MTTAGASVRGRVLVVDDSADLGASMTAALELLGFDARSSSNGHDALQCMASWLPQIVFLDLTMPEFGGVDVLRAARDHDWGRAMLLIAMTGWDADAHRADALAAGFDVFMEKPFDLVTLRTLLSPYGALGARDGRARS